MSDKTPSDALFTIRFRLHHLFLLLSILLYCIPVLSWHLLNNALPTSDAVTYLSDAFESYTKIYDFHSFAQHIYLDRGWRPQMFPVYAVPFLLATQGDPFAAVAGVSLMFSLIFIVYLYLLLRLQLEPISACVSTLAIGSASYLFHYNLVFFSELAYMTFIMAFFYHLLRADFFSRHMHALMAGVFLGLALCIRPAEALMFAPVILYFAAIGFLRGSIRLTEIWMAVNVALAILVAIFYITYVIGFNNRCIPWIFLFAFLSFTLMASLAALKKYPFFIFIFALSTLLFAYWLPAIPALINWSIEASVGDVVKTLGLTSAPFFALAFSVYLNWKELLLPLFILLPFALAGGGRQYGMRAIKSPIFMAVFLMLAVTCIMFLSVVNDGQVARRTLTVVILLNVFLLSFLLNRDMRFRRIFFVLILMVCLCNYTAIIGITTGSSASWPVALNKIIPTEHALQYGVARPDREMPDKHLALMRQLTENADKYGLIGKNIALTLIEEIPGSWDPFTGSLASRIVKAPFYAGFVYVTSDQDAYQVMKKNGIDFVLVDSGENATDKMINTTPSVHGKFAASLIKEYRKGAFTHLKLVDILNINGHKILLLRFPAAGT